MPLMGALLVTIWHHQKQEHFQQFKNRLSVKICMSTAVQARNAASDSDSIRFLNQLMTQHMYTLAAYAGHAASHPGGPQSAVMWLHLALKTLHVIKLVRDLSTKPDLLAGFHKALPVQTTKPDASLVIEEDTAHVRQASRFGLKQRGQGMAE